MSRVYNFSSGPSCLPLLVLEKAQNELLEHGASGQSVMEMSHRTPEFEEILASCEVLLRELLKIPDGYKVLFLQGGAWTQFSTVPLNLLHSSADYVITGQWAKKAYQEAKKFGEVRAVASSEDRNFTYIPAIEPQQLNKNADYLYFCMNNTIYGTRFSALPEAGNVPLVSDISSCILSEPLDVSRFALLFAGAQKNLSCAGLTVVIVREDLLGKTPEGIPEMMKYDVQAKNGSMFNTPPCYAIYIAKLVLEWLKEQGGLEQMKRRNEYKAALLYDYLDNSKLFTANIPNVKDRSLMNVCFSAGGEENDRSFVAGAAKRGMINLKGHRSVGGIRASIYNAMPYEGVAALVDYMKQFEMGIR